MIAVGISTTQERTILKLAIVRWVIIRASILINITSINLISNN